MKKKEKILAFWGIGKVYKFFLEKYTDVTPEVLIDSSFELKEYNGKKIRHPNEIEEWQSYYIVITVSNYADIKMFLETKGLAENKDFCWYKDFFAFSNPSMAESIKLICEYKENSHKAPIMTFMPTIFLRNIESFTVFFNEYIRQRSPQEVVLFTNLKSLSGEIAMKRYHCQVFDIANISNGYDNINTVDENFSTEKDFLSVEEIEWINELAKRKKYIYIEEVERKYSDYKRIIEILNPAQIIVWGNWHVESYILGYLAKKNSIKHGFMEHGWIPGTNQYDSRGIAGQSEYAVNSTILAQIEVSSEEIKEIQKVKQYIKENNLDTGIFENTKSDADELKKLNAAKKTVFLVGMDEAGMGMNPQNDYWDKYISNIYKSVESVLKDLKLICKKNGFNLIFKPHPGVQPTENSSIDFSEIIYIKNMSIDCLIQMSDVVVSIASAVDYKVLLYEKPLVQVGITGLRGKSCSYEVLERNQLESLVKEALVNGMTEKQKKNYDIFLARLLKRYLWDDMSEKDISYGLTLDINFGEV